MESEIVGISVISSIIFFSLLYFVINLAVDFKTRNKYDIMKIKLLMKIAAKNGVDGKEIDQIVGNVNN